MVGDIVKTCLEKKRYMKKKKKMKNQKGLEIHLFTEDSI